MTTTTIDLFPKMVGQEAAKRKLRFFIEGYERTNIVPHLLFCAPKGTGKTMMAREFARNLLNSETLEPKSYTEINCATIRNLRQFVEQVMAVHVNNVDKTILFDECSELPKDVSMALLTVLNPNSTHTNTFSYEGYDFEIDFRRTTFIFATTEPQDVFHSLMDRLERIDLEDYSYVELAKILRICTPEHIRFEGMLLSDHIAPSLRGNARAAQKMADHIVNYVSRKDNNKFNKNDWDKLKDILDVLPFGMTKIELKLLGTLYREGMLRLYNLAAKMQMSRSAIQNNYEVYLQKLNLIEVTQNGRRLTKAGEKLMEEDEI